MKLLYNRGLVAFTGSAVIDEKSVAILSMMRNKTQGTSYFPYVYPNAG